MRSPALLSAVVTACLVTVSPTAQAPVPSPAPQAPAAAQATQAAAPSQAATVPAPAAPVSQQPAPADTGGYVWAEACKPCHGAIHEAWLHTKHAKTLERLSPAERATDCVGCHVSGPKQVILAGATVANAGVQCESCHGPGQAHVEAAKSGGAVKMTKKPGAPVCEQCHNAKSPHYRGFFYGALSPLVHRVR